MIKTLGVRLEEDFIKQVKMLAIQQGVSVQEYVRLALVAYENKEQPAPAQKEEEPIRPIPEPVYTPQEHTKSERPFYLGQDTFSKRIERGPLDSVDHGIYCVIRKTASVGKAEVEDATKFNGKVLWSVPAGCKQHYDVNGGLIPFRYTDRNKKVVNADDDEIDLLIEAYGQTVKIEE